MPRDITILSPHVVDVLDLATAARAVTDMMVMRMPRIAVMIGIPAATREPKVISRMINIIHVILRNVCVPFRVSEDMINITDRPPR